MESLNFEGTDGGDWKDEGEREGDGETVKSVEVGGGGVSDVNSIVDDDKRGSLSPAE